MVSADISEIVAALTGLRKTVGLAQYEVAARMGNVQSTVSQIETGVVEEPRWSTLVRYAAACGAELGFTVRVHAASAAEPKASTQ